MDETLPPGLIADTSSTLPPGLVAEPIASSPPGIMPRAGEAGSGIASNEPIMEKLKALLSMAAPTGGAIGGAALGSLLGPVGAAMGAGGGGYLGGKLNQVLGLSQGGGLEDLLNAIVPMLPGIGQGTLKALASPAKPILAAEAKMAANASTNAAAKIAFEKAIAERQAAEQQVAQAQTQVTGGAGPAGPVPSLGTRVQAPIANREAFGFMNEPIVPLPEINLAQTTEASNKLLTKLEGVPKTLQPPKIPAVAGELAGEQVPAGYRNLGQEALAQIQAELQSSNGKMSLDKVQQSLQGLGRIMDGSADPRTIGLSRYLYSNIMDDLRASPEPQAQQFVKAQATANQNRAASEISDIVTKYGTQVDSFGRIKFDAGKIANAITKDPSLSDALPPEQWKEVQQTLETVFKSNQGLESLPKITAMKELPENITPTLAHGTGTWTRRITGGLIAAPFLGAMGIPHPFLIGEGVAMLYPRIIFKAAMTAPGRVFIRQLYKTAAPSINDVGQFTALVNFLRSQGQNPFPQGDPNASIP
jgi:hypothetical protein